MRCRKAIALFGLWTYPALYLTALLPVATLQVAHSLDRLILGIECWSINRVAEDLCNQTREKGSCALPELYFQLEDKQLQLLLSQILQHRSLEESLVGEGNKTVCHLLEMGNKSGELKQKVCSFLRPAVLMVKHIFIT